MSGQPPLRFGIGPAGLETSPERWCAFARRVEAAGFSSLNVGDHPSLDRLGPLVAMTAAALSTSELRIGVHTFGNDYRHPAVLAKELATLDRLANGRLEVGIGAGWLEDDYRATGIDLDPAGVRIDRLAEAVDVLRGLFAGDPVEYRGSHYRIDGLEGTPRPAQALGPPIMMGGGGPKMLSLAARKADIVGLNFSFRSGSITSWATETVSTRATLEKLAVVREAAGARLARIELAVTNYGVALTDDKEGAAAALGGPYGLSAAEVLDSPHFLVGPVGEVADTLETRRASLGISYVSVGGASFEPTAQLIEHLHGP